MGVVQIARWADRLRKAGGILGASGSEILEGAQPTLQLDDLNASPYKFLGRDYLVAGHFNVVAAAGQFATIDLGFVAGQGANELIWVQQLHLTTDVATGVTICIDGAPAGAFTTEQTQSRDTRAPHLAGQFLLGLIALRSSSEVAVIAESFRAGHANMGAGTDKDLPVDFIISQGHALQVQCTTAAVTLRGYLLFQVLQREPSER